MRRLCWRQFVLVFFFICLLPQVCRANPIAIDPFELGADALLFLLFDAVIDLAVLVIAFVLVREAARLGFGTFPLYFLAVVIGGLFIDLGAIFITHEHIAFGSLLILLTGYNIFLCRVFFGIKLLKAAFVGLMVGVFTNPVLWLFIVPFSYSHNF